MEFLRKEAKRWEEKKFQAEAQGETQQEVSGDREAVCGSKSTEKKEEKAVVGGF